MNSPESTAKMKLYTIKWPFFHKKNTYNTFINKCVVQKKQEFFVGYCRDLSYCGSQ